MARIFSIQFSYRNVPRNALVAVHNTPFHTEYKIILQDEEIQNLLPGDKIISTIPNQFVFPNIAFHTYTDLMREIIKEIAGHVLLLQQ